MENTDNFKKDKEMLRSIVTPLISLQNPRNPPQSVIHQLMRSLMVNSPEELLGRLNKIVREYPEFFSIYGISTNGGEVMFKGQPIIL